MGTNVGNVAKRAAAAGRRGRGGLVGVLTLAGAALVLASCGTGRGPGPAVGAPAGRALSLPRIAGRGGSSTGAGPVGTGSAATSGNGGGHPTSPGAGHTATEPPRSGGAAAGRTGATSPVGGGTGIGSPGTGSSSTAQSRATAGATRVVELEPFTASGSLAPSLHVTGTTTGTCVDVGVAGGSSYRCFASSPGGAYDIYDPCFAGPKGTGAPLVCVTNPLDQDVVELRPTSLQDLVPTPAPPRPWAMELADGQVCVLVNSAWDGLGPFACSAGASGSGAGTSTAGGSGSPGAGSTSSGHAGSGAGTGTVQAAGAASGGTTGGSAAPSEMVADCHEPQSATPWWAAACQAVQSASSPFTAERVVEVWR